MPEVIPAGGSRRGRGTQNGSGPTAQADKDASISNVAMYVYIYIGKRSGCVVRSSELRVLALYSCENSRI